MTRHQPFTRVLCPALDLVPPNSSTDRLTAAVKHFSSIQWCQKLLSVRTEDQQEAVHFLHQGLNPENDEWDQFIAVTLTSPRALTSALCFFRPDDAQHTEDPERPIARIFALFSVGEGLSSWKGVVHGGMVMTMIDTTFAALIEINAALGKSWARKGGTTMTASLSTKFLRPALLGQEVCVSAWFGHAEGRKIILKAEMLSSDGSKLAVAESTWITVKAKM